ncbi:DDE-domain-containing protein, partial [Aulographum hederae CBS 113979]
QRRALRVWYRQQGPSIRQIDATNWFERKYNHRLRQSTVSKSLGARFAYLDTGSILPTASSTFRQRQSQWPILEAVLCDWHQLVEEQGGEPSGEAILLKAKEIWPRIPQYANQPVPELSLGWLANFKRRHNIQSRIKHGEAASVPIEAEEQMRAVQTLCGEYEEEDIFNMDETGLFWRATPSQGLTVKARPGRKRDKNRISIVCCVNFTGTRRFPLWVIGRSAKPHALRNVNIQSLGIAWRSNQKAWMTAVIMADWLQAFYSWIGDRSVLLLMDILRAHIAGIELQPPPSNIRIQWLPPNATSLYQPLDQGIIQNFKHYYKKEWLQFMLDHYERRSDPIEAMNLFFAIRWASQAWNFNITNTTIYRCFRHAKILPSQQPISLPAEPLPDLQLVYQQVQRASNIRDAMDLSNFLNPSDENVEPSVEPTTLDVDQIIASHVEHMDDSDDDEVDIPIPTSQEAAQALELLLRYQAHQQRATTSEIRSLQGLQRDLQAQIASQASQVTLDRWFT